VLDTTEPASVYEARHARKVQRIAAQLKAHRNGEPVSLHKNAPPHQVPKFGDLRRHDDKIEVGALTEILSIDPERRICVAESGVMFEDVVAATLRHGLVPIVVPELKTITVGGAVSGCSVESMSFEHGGFHDTCLAYEVITSDGEVLAATPDNEHGLVFQMMHCSFGTLGVLSKLTFRLVPAKPFVKVSYEHHATLASYRASIERHAALHDIDFMDGIIHASDDLVLSCGTFVDRAPYTHAYDWMRIYYLSTRERRDDYLRTEDYLFRYDRGVTSVNPRSFLGRLFLGKILDSGTTLWLADKLHRVVLERERPTVTLDVFLPMSRLEAFLAWWEREFAFYPLWCVPYRRVQDYPWLAESFYANLADEMFVDIAIYGLKQTGDQNYHRMIEEKLRELGGIKTLISHNYYSHDEFWKIWNKRNYEAVKAITDRRNLFRDLYTKTCKAAMGVAA
jgi:FAD/FMN-containing dehydrogenase